MKRKKKNYSFWVLQIFNNYSNLQRFETWIWVFEMKFKQVFKFSYFTFIDIQNLTNNSKNPILLQMIYIYIYIEND